MGSHKLSHYQFLRLQIPRFLPVFLRPNRNSVLVQCDLYFIDRLFPGTCNGNFSAEFLVVGNVQLATIVEESIGFFPLQDAISELAGAFEFEGLECLNDL